MTRDDMMPTADARTSNTGDAGEASATLHQRALAMMRARQDDLLVLTHQLQGTLVAVAGAPGGVDVQSLSDDDRALIDHASVLVEDAIALVYGTSTALAGESGREMSFHPRPLD